MRLEALEPLQIRSCSTVSELVEAGRKCSFGARMLGEVASTLTEWVRSDTKPTLIYEGDPNSQLSCLIYDMVKRGWFKRRTLVKAVHRGDNTLVIGHYPEQIAALPGRTIYINNCGRARPGQIRDGHFPDAVFADPRFALPMLVATLSERIDGVPRYVVDFVSQDLVKYGGLASEVVRGAETLKAMVKDPDCTVFLTMTGAMTIAKMGLLICDMIEMGMVHAIATTGALMAHGLVESVGLKHYKHDPDLNDAYLAKHKLNRITHTLEPETNFDHIEEILDTILWKIRTSRPITPSRFHSIIGRYLAKKHPNEWGILKSAYEHHVPVFVPAFVDSEIANDVYVHNEKRRRKRKPRVVMDMELDTRRMMKIATRAKKLGIFTVGGGVPRNNVQNVAPLIEIINARLGRNLKECQFSYGCRIAPDELWYGHLSGCTYSEGMSWRKMRPDGMFAEVHTDATLVWPMIVRYVMDSE
ncbi:MAG TPA: deoxyhypusine synthase family protein [Candidatus Paceibacterota bacterium]